MKRLALVAALAAVPSLALAQVNVSVNLGDPNFYGQIDIGDYPQPQLVNAQPVVIEQGGPEAAPIYLHVPTAYSHDWKHHCAQYNACNRPVYFVQDSWYKKTYAPEYKRRHAAPAHAPAPDHHDAHDDHGPDDHGHDDHH